jgi:hypothetical protein
MTVGFVVNWEFSFIMEAGGHHAYISEQQQHSSY